MRHSLAAVSQAVAACCERAPAKSAAMVDRFVGQLGGGGGSEAAFSLLCLGEIGKRTDLSSHATLLNTVTQHFTSTDEDTRAAASFALGSIAAGNVAAFVPHLLKAVDASEHDYLMLHAFKEMLGAGGDSLAGFASQLLPKLLAFAERDEEGVRNVVAECLGRLAAVSPGTVVPQLEALLPSPSAATRATVIGCIRCAVTELGTALLPPSLQSSLLGFLGLLEDADLKVKRGAVLTLNCLAHNKPSAIKELLPTLLPLLYGETAKKPELVHQVDLGPFKHTVDDGLEIRKVRARVPSTATARAPIHCTAHLSVPLPLTAHRPPSRRWRRCSPSAPTGSSSRPSSRTSSTASRTMATSSCSAIACSSTSRSTRPPPPSSPR